ncbi:30S ribosomal protein S1 [Campylobacter jejuni]|uniref:30S ribosomal protein S1 n=4 Tax=Campylobacter jejuni TaxID=197 RepID=Q0PA05_CAMJE|nr:MULTISPECIES: 30S ribosomal protein S1 [Campylobacter]YP_002344292.1 30S ribosomal protein S1 [Campylobacter jejuni subsp. jejuni NCTC 11168 = ATCC 700819]EAI3655886.1 30S ribosomal protein S1 [Campylobacter fetus]EFV06889.1 S1 RNA binding domain protein [Campylobacter jejuni subsp. jejuni DFVF1099]EFV09122.1 S1 RNA binding domain protein [Campylobacter jejuni subsp. jejuni 305]WPM67537.1 30S ribosomal protein S1 [Campylobacter sp. CFSAN122778]AFU42957.1 30S ribosomal protein S1 [Campyloba
MSEVNKKVQDGVDDYLEEEDFGQLLEAFDKSREEATTEGVIVEIKNDEVYVDIGKKSEGILALSEIQGDNSKLLFNVGDSIKVAVMGSRGGRSLLSHKKALRKEKVIEFIKNYQENQDDIFTVKVVGKNKGGLIVVDENDVEFFLPKSQYGFKETNNIIGKTFKVKIIKIDKDEQSIIVSRKKTLDDERRKRKELINNVAQQEDLIEGIVKKITTYGMFVDVGGVDGLVHYSEISYKGPVNPGTLYKEGDKVPVKVIKYDKERKHLSLSIKAALPDPWSEIKDTLDIGDTIKVIVSNIEPYGAFVDLGNDIEGFLHISEISWDKNIKNPKDYINKGQEIDVEVIEINPNERRLRVSLRNLLSRPFDEFMKSYKIADVVEGEITSVTSFGAFVKLGGIEGLLHNEDASWDRNDKCKDKFSQGDKIKVKIIKIDEENQKISLSTKELSSSPVQEYAKIHKVGDIVKGAIRDIKDFGVFVELSKNVDALIHKEDISTSMLENLKIGDDIEAAIVFIDEKKNRIRLSVKNLVRIKEREVLNEINNDDKVTLGDIIKDQLA